MKAWKTAGDGIEALREVETERPVTGPGQVLVQPRAWALNYRDLLVIRGESIWKPTAPTTPISDNAGVVAEVGPGVTRVAPGDRVSAMFRPYWRSGPLTREVYHSATGGPVGPGMLADYVLFDQDHVELVPHTLSDEQAATLPVAALTAWHGVAVRCRVRAGDRVLVHGTGGVALFALQFAVAMGAEAMVSTSSEEKAKRVLDLGAARAVNREETPDVASEVLDWTEGRGVDHVIETVGGTNLDQSLAAVAVSGSIAFIGLIGGTRAPVNTYEFVTKNVELHGVETGSSQMYREMAAFIDEHRIEPVIDTVLPVTEIRSALRRLEAGAHLGKIVLTAG